MPDALVGKGPEAPSGIGIASPCGVTTKSVAGGGATWGVGAISGSATAPSPVTNGAIIATAGPTSFFITFAAACCVLFEGWRTSLPTKLSNICLPTPIAACAVGDDWMYWVTFWARQDKQIMSWP